MTMAYLEITLQVDAANRAAAAGVYQQYNKPYLDTVPGATCKELLVRDEDVQVLHGFETAADAKAYLASELFTRDVVGELTPLLNSAPDVAGLRRRLNGGKRERFSGTALHRSAHPVPHTAAEPEEALQ
jgi:hypothetical protein